MNVVSSTRTEVDYTFKMTQADLDRYLADPWAWRDDTQAQLKGVAAAAGDGEVKPRRAKPGPRSQITIGRGKRKAAAKNGPGRPRSARQRGRPASSSGMVREQCPSCGEMITSKYMALHQRTKHGHANGSAPAPAPEPAIAAG